MAHDDLAAVSSYAVRKRTVVRTLLGLFIAWALPEFALLSRFAHATGFREPIVREVFFWIVTVVLLIYVITVERRPLSSIGVRRPTWRTWIWALVAGVLLVAGIVFIYSVVFPVFHLTMNRAAASRIMAMPWLFRFFMVLRAAIFEEIAYRGYPIERLSELTKLPLLAAAISWVVFTLAHLSYWGFAQLIVAGYGGLILTALYLWRRDLISNMVAHFIADGSGFLLG